MVPNSTEVEENYDKCSIEEGLDTLYLVLFFAVAATGIILNSIQIYWLLRKKNHWTSNDVFILSLSISDLLYAILRSMFVALHLISDPEFERSLIMVALFIIVMHLLLLTVDRFFAVLFPIWHRVKVTKRKTVLACVGIWLITGLVSLSGYIIDVFIQLQTEQIYSIVSMTLIFVSGSSYVIIYSLIAYKVKMQSKAFKTSTVKKTGNGQRRTIKISVLICSVFIVTNFPAAITAFLHICQRWMFLLQLASCSLDSVVYFWMGKKKTTQDKPAKTVEVGVLQ